MDQSRQRTPNSGPRPLAPRAGGAGLHPARDFLLVRPLPPQSRYSAGRVSGSRNFSDWVMKVVMRAQGDLRGGGSVYTAVVRRVARRTMANAGWNPRGTWS